MKDIYVLGIESSCDDTSVAVVKNGRYVLSNVISSQVDIHKIYGGVVPEIASRKHTENISYVYGLALKEANLKINDIDAIAVTYGPGLVGALLVGLSFAKGLSIATNKPFIGINHIEGHICANFITNKNLEPPFLALVVSGGHTNLVLVKDYLKYKIYARTHDDACGECFDKVARVLNMEYPGGPKIEKKASEVSMDLYNFPRGKIEGYKYDFTFSGLKSCVINQINKLKNEKRSKEKKIGTDIKNILLDDETVKNISYSFQNAVIDSLVFNTIQLAKDIKIKKIAICGGVSANKTIRNALKTECDQNGFEFFCPDNILCTDNAAMIASSGYYRFIKNKFSKLNLNADPNLEFNGE